MHFHPLSVFSVLAFGPFNGLATPFASHWDDFRAKHTWNSVPENWNNLGHPPADTTIDLHIALKAKNENALIDALIEVSSPGHPKEEVAELVAPPSDVLELANAWLDHHGVQPSTISTKHGGSWLTLTGVPVSRANELLSASYQLYQHIGTNETVLRTLSVAPTTHFGFPRTPRRELLMRRGGATMEQTKVPGGDPGTVLSNRDEYTTPSFLRTLYKTSTYVPLAAGWNMLGVAGYDGDWPSLDDLGLFMDEYRFDAIDATYRVVQIEGGGYNPNNPDIEANLNMQYTSAIAYPTTHIFYSTGKSTGDSDTLGDGFINWLDYVLGQLSVPQTVSTVYGLPEYKVPQDYATHVCDLFARLGARGASVLFSSGNDGVGHGNCLVKDSSGSSRVQFLPTFPSTCPWVTSVGGTTGYNPEIAASFSGGGFSVLFPRPPYQKNAVPTFLSNLGGRYNGLYNPGGRGIPDIALQAMGFPIIFKDKLWEMDGTSCATPVRQSSPLISACLIADVQTAAGIISLLNDYRISNGRPPLGFLNVWLYGICLGGLNDITSGSNPGCNTDGFSAVPGWDPVTGLGSLDFERLVSILSRW
ncbi:subtilisin-like protein [Lactarius pseudohatsudake]|nr:subtilisin-like protein [Lactarius pseudohatsudake]